MLKVQCAMQGVKEFLRGLAVIGNHFSMYIWSYIYIHCEITQKVSSYITPQIWNFNITKQCVHLFGLGFKHTRDESANTATRHVESSSIYVTV